MFYKLVINITNIAAKMHTQANLAYGKLFNIPTFRAINIDFVGNMTFHKLPKIISVYGYSNISARFSIFTTNDMNMNILYFTWHLIIEKCSKHRRFVQTYYIWYVPHSFLPSCILWNSDPDIRKLYNWVHFLDIPTSDYMAVINNDVWMRYKINLRSIWIIICRILDLF